MKHWSDDGPRTARRFRRHPSARRARPRRSAAARRRHHRRLDRRLRHAGGAGAVAFRKDADALADRVAVNVALARLSEIDDIHLAAMITPGAIVVPAALTIAASLPDVARRRPRGGDCRGLRGDDPAWAPRSTARACSIAASGRRYFAAPFGAAAVAARLLKLDEKQTANALSAALIMAAPGTGHHAAPTTVRWLAVGPCRRPRPAGGAGGGRGLHLGREDRRRRFPQEHLRHRAGRRAAGRRLRRAGACARSRSSPGARRARPWRRRRR